MIIWIQLKLREHVFCLATIYEKQVLLDYFYVWLKKKLYYKALSRQIISVR